MKKCAQSLSVFLVFALGIWTICYEPLVSGSSCSLFWCTFLAQCFVRLWIHVLRSDSMVQFLVWSSTCPLVCNNRALVRQWRKLWVPQLLLLFVVAVPCLQVVQILWCKCGGDSRLPQLQLVRTCSWTRSLTCLRCVTAGAWSSVQKLRILRTCSSSTRCGRPCDFAVTCLAVEGATDSVHRLIWWTSQFAQRQWYVAAMRDPG